MHKFAKTEKMSRNLFLAIHKKKNNCSYLKANYAIVNIIRHKDVCIKYGRFSIQKKLFLTLAVWQSSTIFLLQNHFPLQLNCKHTVQLVSSRKILIFVRFNGLVYGECDAWRYSARIKFWCIVFGKSLIGKYRHVEIYLKHLRKCKKLL